MKTIVSTILSAAFAGAAFAQVPNLINYQGRLTDANGAAVTGTKNFSISIFDAATGGNLLYTETIGAVTLDANGVYSFQFGGTGTSNTRVTETVASTSGTATTFQKVLANSPVVAGSVSVSDGTYTWSQSAGSSNEDDFGVAYSTSLRRVTANYYNGAPAAGRTITATYRYGTSGITGALSSGAEHWIAVSLDSVTQGVRQRVLAVPFSRIAGSVTEIDENLLDVPTSALLKTSKAMHDLITDANGAITSKISYAVSPNLPIQPTTAESPLGSLQINNLLRYITINHPGPGGYTHTATIHYQDGTTSVSSTQTNWFYNANGEGWSFIFDNPHIEKIVTSVETSGGTSASRVICILNGPQEYEFQLPSNISSPGRYFVSVATSNPQLMGNYECSLVSLSNEIIGSATDGILNTKSIPTKVKVRLFPSNVDPASRSHVGSIKWIRVTKIN
jgi:hypothetical protein